MIPGAIVLLAALFGSTCGLAQGAVHLDGVSGYGLVPDHSTYDLSGDFTIEAAVVFDSLATSRQSTVLSKLSEWNARNVVLEYSYPEGQRFRFGGRGSDWVEWNVGIGNFVPELHRCYHVAGVREGNQVSFYLDGQLMETQVLPSVGDASNGGAWRIGQVLDSIRWFPGLIDEVRVWDHARSAANIAADAWRALSGAESGLVGLWPFDDGAGTVFADHSATGNDGTLVGAFSWASTACLQSTDDLAILLDGVSGHGRVPDHPAYALGNHFTLEAEVVFDSLALSRQSTILSKMEVWNERYVALEYTYPEYQRFYFGGRGANGIEWRAGIDDFVPVLGRCYHVAGVRDNDQFIFYLDGVELDRQTYAGAGAPDNPGEWQIGQVLNSIRWFPGSIDEVRVWNLTRSQAQIGSAMHQRIAGDTPGLVACWRFDDGQGSLFADVSPTDNPGQLYGGTLWVADELCQPAPETPAVTQTFWIHRRSETFSGLTTGVAPGPYSVAGRADQVWIGMHNGDMAWHLRMYGDNQVLSDHVIAWPGDRWLQVRIEWFADGPWRCTWDLGGADEQVFETSLPGPIPLDPHVWLTPTGYYENTGGFYLDDLQVVVVDESGERTLEEDWEDGDWTQCPHWEGYFGADDHFAISGMSHGGDFALEGIAGSAVSDHTALVAAVDPGPETLQPISDLAISQLPDLSMQLAWSPVTQTICGDPAEPDGYIVYYSEQPGDPEDYYYLGYAYTNGYIHPRAAEFSSLTLYQVVPHRGADPAVSGATRGMQRSHVRALIAANIH